MTTSKERPALSPHALAIDDEFDEVELDRIMDAGEKYDEYFDAHRGELLRDYQEQYVIIYGDCQVIAGPRLPDLWRQLTEEQRGSALVEYMTTRRWMRLPFEPWLACVDDKPD